jgi:hypothetical protein
MWDAVQYDNTDFDEDQRALEALLAAIPRRCTPPWDAITVARIDSDCARRSMLQKLHQEWENLTFKTGEDVNDFTLHLNTLMQ